MRSKGQSKGKRRRLSWEILEYLLISLAIAAFTYLFLFHTSGALAGTYLQEAGIRFTPLRQRVLEVWLGSVCGIASVAVFLVLFLFMLGQRLSYLLKIIRGVEGLQKSRMEGNVPLEGNDELTELAERLNRLAASERELSAQEQRLLEEREAFVRSLSHDIRTPLTSMLSATQLMLGKEALDKEETEAYLRLMEAKAEQIKTLSDRLLCRGSQHLVPVEHIRLLMEQLAAEWEELLEESFSCETDLSGLPDFPGMADVYSLRRIFDNLASNGEKYADPEYPVELRISGTLQEGRQLVELCQKNRIRLLEGAAFREAELPESFGIGLESIRRIASDYQGRVEVRRDRQEFEVRIFLEIPEHL